MSDYERLGREAAVKVIAVFMHPDGSFTVKGTLERSQVPVVLRGVADQIEEDDG